MNHLGSSRRISSTSLFRRDRVLEADEPTCKYPVVRTQMAVLRRVVHCSLCKNVDEEEVQEFNQ